MLRGMIMGRKLREDEIMFDFLEDNRLRWDHGKLSDFYGNVQLEYYRNTMDDQMYPYNVPGVTLCGRMDRKNLEQHIVVLACLFTGMRKLYAYHINQAKAGYLLQYSAAFEILLEKLMELQVMYENAKTVQEVEIIDKEYLRVCTNSFIYFVDLYDQSEHENIENISELLYELFDRGFITVGSNDENAEDYCFEGVKLSDWFLSNLITMTRIANIYIPGVKNSYRFSDKRHLYEIMSNDDFEDAICELCPSFGKFIKDREIRIDFMGYAGEYCPD